MKINLQYICNYSHINIGTSSSSGLLLCLSLRWGIPAEFSPTSALHPNSYLQKGQAFLYKFFTYSFLELVFRLPLLLKPTQAPGPSCLYRQAINALAFASDDATAAL